MQILGGFIAVLGAVAVAVALTVFSGGILISLATFGAGSFLIGLGLFACSKESSINSDDYEEQLAPQ